MSGIRSVARNVFSWAEGEVLGEPPRERDPVDDLRGASVGEPRVTGDVGGAGDLALMAGDEDTVLGGDQVWLDVVGAHPDRQAVGLERVLRELAAGPAVGNHQRRRRRPPRGDRRRGLGGPIGRAVGAHHCT